MRVCRECGISIKGRSDKRYCGDNCRSAYNNKQNKTTKLRVRLIARVLMSNRNILKQCHSRGVGRLDQAALKAMGFSFKYSTHSEFRADGAAIRFCYDYGYVELQGQILITPPGDVFPGLQNLLKRQYHEKTPITRSSVRLDPALL